jgi:hypothetical protein
MAKGKGKRSAQAVIEIAAETRAEKVIEEIAAEATEVVLLPRGYALFDPKSGEVRVRCYDTGTFATIRFAKHRLKDQTIPTSPIGATIGALTDVLDAFNLSEAFTTALQRALNTIRSAQDWSTVLQNGIAAAEKAKEEARKRATTFTAIDPENPNLRREVSDLMLSVRTLNGLRNACVIYVGDLVQKTEAELLRTRHFGRVSLAEVKKYLTERGLRLGMTPQTDIS